MINLFLLAENKEESVKYFIDSHIVKIILEIAQVIFNIRHMLGIINNKYKFYRPSHIYHPFNKWGSKTFDNYMFFVNYVFIMNNEHVYRYNKSHKSAILISDIYNDEKDSIKEYFPLVGLDVPIQAMPFIYQEDSNKFILAYRKYYFFHKRFLVYKLYWTLRPIPYWFNNEYFISHGVML